MRKLICILFFYFLTLNASAQQQVSNGGFEHWYNLNTGLQPDSFVSPLSFSASYANCILRTSSAYSGQYAALIQTEYIAGMNYPGYISYGVVHPVTNLPVGHVFSSRPDQLKFWYKFLRNGNDSGFVFINLIDNTGQMVGTGYMFFDQSVTSYTPAAVTIQYFSLAQPDTIEIVFSAGVYNSCTVGTQLYVDDVSLNYGPSSVGEASLRHIAIYPNPSDGQLNIDLREKGSLEVVITSYSGMVVYRKQVPAEHSSFDVPGLVPGLYNVRIQSSTAVYFGRFIKR